MLSIAKRNTIPPGGFKYVQPETGMKFDGNNTFKSQVYAILSHRRGNHLARATFDDVAEDLVTATCLRVPALCIQRGGPASAAAVAAARAMPAERTVRRCGSCGGRKASK